jgi:hypothetical protein
MSFVVLQALINILFIVTAFLFLSYRRRIDQLEAELAKLQAERPSAEPRRLLEAPAREVSVPQAPLRQAPVPQVLIPQELTPQGPTTSTLVEKPVSRQLAPRKKTLRDSDPAAAFEKAEELLSRGLKAPEVARLTGLSLSELSLMGKVGRRVQ